MTYENINVEIDEELMCTSLENWIKDHVDDQSFRVYAKIAEDVGVDLEEIQRAVGAAVLNQIFVDALKRQMREDGKRKLSKILEA